ncbi:DUF6447 family protein [Sulfuricurvum sp.]|uniref:DUF6447 family protein n=1 Tax=Sulfuricurvum sp. TaxID=2025608 RepID=UPI00260D117E|nr:DUF6447 family protein [Sulfuricurvum sp.]MDD2266039.1 DUF6447 family protein [Sulfuricurvum sp.]MDD2783051.1 DUF6447 family protein [Sulfuricurvum sp.]
MEKKILKFNDKEYKISDLSEEAKAQLTNLRVCDAEISRLKAQLAITETARNTYTQVLSNLLPKK